MGRNLVLLALAALTVEQVYAQASAWSQCGGVGFTGPTTCVSGYYCSYQNDWYSQCLPGTGSSSITSSSSVISTSAAGSTASSAHTTTTSSIRTSTSTAASSTTSQTCTAAFTPITASAAFAGLNPGWNLGNSLDSVPDEGSWNNVPVTNTTLVEVVEKGFKSIRIPVTWAYHFIGKLDAVAPYTVDSTWLDRVEVVVDEVLATGAYAVLNVHHDSWIWMDVTAANANYTLIEEKFGSLWTQIATRFACKSSKLIFEAVNEPTGNTEAHAAELTRLNDIFLTAVNNAGGYNPQRVVSLSGLGMDSIMTSEWFSRGTLYPNQPWGIQFHYYSPYDFIFSAWGKTIWGSDADKASLLQDFTLFKGNFSDIPAFVGEFDASPQSTEPAARWKYFDYFARTATSFGYSLILWDNGLDHFDRDTDTWSDPIAIDILKYAVAGTRNSLADSTTDASATSQNSSATLFHKVGDAVTNEAIPYLLNGNTLSSITNSAGAKLTSSQYSMSTSGTLTLTSAYLSTLYTATSATGLKDTLTLTFSAGAPSQIQIYQYSAPSIATTSYNLATIGDSASLNVAVTYNGMPKIAAVKAVLADGTPMVDTWTVYLGPLQQACWTWSDWTWSDTGLTIDTAGLDVIKAAGQTITLTVEFFPRVYGSNEVNLTFTQS